MIDNSYYIILNRLKAFANGHYLINTFTYHEIANFDITKNPHYPIMHAVPLSMNPSKGAIDYSFEITFADWVRAKEEKQENEVTVISDLHRCALDLCAEITNGNILFGDEVTIQGDAIIIPFIDEFANTLSGVTLQITIRIPYDWSACDIPANWVDGTGDIPDFGGRSLTMDIYDEGNFVVAAREMNFVGSGVTVTYTGNRAIVTINGGSGGGAVDSVNGQTGVVVLDASDVGADAAGSAAAALVSANSYTDVQINALDADDIEETATRFWLTSLLKTAYDGAVTWISTNGADILNHLSNTSNPHNVTASQVGLGNADNTSDLDKPISTATQAALDALTNTLIDSIRTGGTVVSSGTRYATEGLAGYSTVLAVTVAPRAVYTKFRVLMTSTQPATGSLTIERKFYDMSGTLTDTQTLVIPAGSTQGIYEYAGASVDCTAVDRSYGIKLVNAATSNSGSVNSIESTYEI